MSAEPAFVEPESSAQKSVPLTLVEPPPGVSGPWPVARDGSSQIMVVAPPPTPIGKQALLISGLAIGLGFLAGWVGWLAMSPAPSVPVTNVEVRAPAAVIAPAPEDIASSSAVPALALGVDECTEAGACAAQTPPEAKEAEELPEKPAAAPKPKPKRPRKPRARNPSPAPRAVESEPVARPPKPAPKQPRFEKLDEGLRELSG